MLAFHIPVRVSVAGLHPPLHVNRFYLPERHASSLSAHCRGPLSNMAIRFKKDKQHRLASFSFHTWVNRKFSYTEPDYPVEFSRQNNVCNFSILPEACFLVTSMLLLSGWLSFDVRTYYLFSFQEINPSCLVRLPRGGALFFPIAYCSCPCF